MGVTFIYRSFSSSKIKVYKNVSQMRLLQQPVTYFSSKVKEGCTETGKLDWIQFSHAQHGNFYQKMPKLYNPFLADIPLQRFLARHVPNEINKEISADLNCFGDRIIHEIDDLGWECELHPPSLSTHNAWGERVDDLVTSSAWKKQHDICAEEGLIAIPYEQKINFWSRLHQICKLYLYSPSSGLYSCPIAMTDGAANTIKVFNESVGENGNPLFLKAFNNLTSRNPEVFWTSGQWMTEKRGGSDVAQSTETVAVPENDFYRLYGYKWFSSATDANMALTLARVAHNGKPPKETEGLTMFYVETKNLEGRLNNLQMVRLKNKLGTRQLPTAELLLDGCIAHKMSVEGRGIASISHMLNITRLHNSIASVAAMRRILMFSRDFSFNRLTFGKKLSDNPLHIHTLCKMEIEVRGSLLLLLKVAILLGKIECCVNTSDEALLLRILSPVLKLYSAKQAVAVVSEGLESFGGQGYIEDTRIPIMYRDCQVLPIWEGTTNVMSLDVIRSLAKTNFDALLSLEKSIVLCLEVGKDIEDLKEPCLAVARSVKEFFQFLKQSPNMMHIAARDIAYSIARTYIGALLIESAAETKNETDIFTAQQWCQMQKLCLLSSQDYSNFMEKDYKTVMEGYITS